MSEQPQSNDELAKSAGIPTEIPSGVQAPLPRLGLVDNVKEAALHVGKSVKNQGSKTRQSDILSSLLMPVTCVALMAASICMSWARLVVALIALCSVMFYVLSRVGIMRTLNERQAVLIWHILSATFLMGITFAFVFLEILNTIR